MPTNDERREVAKKLSGYNPEWLSLRNLSKETIVNYCLLWKALEESFPEINEHVHDISDKLYNLGKLIEPEQERTCEIMHDDNLSEQYFGPMYRCYSCGAALPEEFIGPYYYCPCCGSKNKVVQDAD